MPLISIAASLVLDYLSIEDSATFAMICQEYRGYTVTYWRTHSLVITDASIPPHTPSDQIRICTSEDIADSEKFALYIPSRTRRLAIPSRLYVPFGAQLSNVECLLLTDSEKEQTVLRPEHLPRLCRLYFNSNVFVFVGDFPNIDYVSVTGTCYREHFHFGNRPSSNIQRININIDNLAHYKVDIPRVSITTGVKFTLSFHSEVKKYAYIKVTCPNEVSVCVLSTVKVDCLIIDAPKVRFIGDPIHIGELHVQAHLWWELRKYKPHLLPSNHSPCCLS